MQIFTYNFNDQAYEIEKERKKRDKKQRLCLFTTIMPYQHTTLNTNRNMYLLPFLDNFVSSLTVCPTIQF